MANINRVVLVGNLTRDPELRHTPSGTSVCKLRIAVNTRQKDQHRQLGRQAQLLRRHRLGQPGARAARSSSPRAGPSRSTAASTGASGTPRTAQAPGGRDHRRHRPVPRQPRRRRAGGGGGGGSQFVQAGAPAGARRRLRRRRRRRHPVLMATAQERQQTRKRPGDPKGQVRRKNCFFCKDKIDEVDYKNYNQLRRYISEKGKIRSRRITGACRRHQRQVALAVKRAREMALLPYVGDKATDGRHPAEGRREARPPRRGRGRRARLRAELPAPAPARRGRDARRRWPRSSGARRARPHEASTNDQAQRVAKLLNETRAPLRRRRRRDRDALRLRHADRHRGRALVAQEDPRRPPQDRPPTRSSAIGRYTVPIEVFSGVVAEVETLVVPVGGEVPPEEELAARAGGRGGRGRGSRAPRPRPPGRARGRGRAAPEAEAGRRARGARAPCSTRSRRRRRREPESAGRRGPADEPSPRHRAARGDDAPRRADRIRDFPQAPPTARGISSSRNSPLASGNTFHSSVRQVWEHMFRNACTLSRSDTVRSGRPQVAAAPRRQLTSPGWPRSPSSPRTSPAAPVPPQNLDAEESVLGAMMLSPGAIGAVSEVLAAADFYRESHGDDLQGRARALPEGRAGRRDHPGRRARGARRARACRRPASDPRARRARPRDRERRALRADRPRDGHPPRPDPRRQRDRAARLGPAGRDRGPRRPGRADRLRLAQERVTTRVLAHRGPAEGELRAHHRALRGRRRRHRRAVRLPRPRPDHVRLPAAAT